MVPGAAKAVQQRLFVSVAAPGGKSVVRRLRQGYFVRLEFM